MGGQSSKQERIIAECAQLVRAAQDREQEARQLLTMVALRCGPLRFRAGDFPKGSGFSLLVDESTGEWVLSYLSPEDLKRLQEERMERMRKLVAMTDSELAAAVEGKEPGAEEERVRRTSPRVLRSPRAS